MKGTVPQTKAEAVTMWRDVLIARAEQIGGDAVALIPAIRAIRTLPACQTMSNRLRKIEAAQ